MEVKYNIYILRSAPRNGKQHFLPHGGPFRDFYVGFFRFLVSAGQVRSGAAGVTARCVSRYVLRSVRSDLTAFPEDFVSAICYSTLMSLARALLDNIYVTIRNYISS